MRTDIYRRIVEASAVDLSPEEAWLLGRIGTTLEQAAPRNAKPEEIALLTGRLIRRGYLTVDANGIALEMTERGRGVYAKLVEAGREELTSLIAGVQPPEEEVAAILRRVAVSLLADMPRDGGAAAITRPG